ncbi:Bacteriophage lambda, Stf, side tail fibre-repeat-2 [uncultured Caudovirales phage]|uniref:Bacteriophage lambda, Stf, side tail fibre-repeat-2 n=1 Tax=uncultured Caudovirales phage TaxID=2100421 RepID=A0A6J5L529_9CAUD|nr:Bacteriophage lambda, Stf, side tail fibre-repeat-2 [uncultured Caudovirales phage]CAB5219154.1 Bacteriophage lambda, Stf, side tail fibre-repeat-2 [uncultured Caudovirales phage]
MARNFYTPINLNGLELQGAAVGNLSTTSINAISSGTGRIQYDSTLNVLKYRDNVGWQTIATGGTSFTLGTTSISLGGTSGVSGTPIAGLYLSNPNLAGTITTPLTTAGYVTNNSSGVLGSVITIPNAGLTNSTISGVSLGGSLFALSAGTGLSYSTGTTYDGSVARTLNVASASTTVVGIVQLSDSTSTTSSTLAATSTAAKAAYDRGSQGITDAATAQTTANAALPKAGGTMSGAIAMGGSKITGLGTPTAIDDAATKGYVDGIASGVNAHDAVAYATTAALGTTGNLVGGTITTTYNNNTTGVGATLTIASSSTWTSITIDGQSLTVNDRVLIKNQTTALQNGIYTVTQVGTLANSTSFIFTRATDNDSVGELAAGDLTFVIAGSVNAGIGYVQTATVTTVGTSSITWSQFSSPSATLAGAGLVTNGTNPNQLDVASTTLSVTTNAVDLTTVTQSNGTTSTSATTFVSAVTVDTYGRVTGQTTGAVPFTALGTSTSTATATAASGTVTSARRVTGAGIGTGTAMVVNHGLGQWVHAQLFDTSGNLVEVDVLNAATSGGTTTFTFASSQTLTGFQYVIVG